MYRKRVTWIVLPEGKRWSVLREGAKRAQLVLTSREEAIERATGLASRRPPSKLLI